MTNSPATSTDSAVEDPEGGLSRAEQLARRLDTPMSVLGVVFVLVVLAQNLAEDAALVSALAVVGWVLWAVFLAEFLLRAVVAGNQRRFWRRNWWQLVFLAVPFLRFVRALALVRVFRVARVGGILSAAVRSSRSAGRLLSGRVTWLGVVTGIVILSSSQLLYVFGAYDQYGSALHETALSTVTGAPLSAEGEAVRVLEVSLAVYSVVVFATLAGALGAYFLQQREDERERALADPSVSRGSAV